MQTFIAKLAVVIANQAAGTLKAFFYMEFVVPGIIGILVCIPMLIYPLRKKE